MGALNQRRQSCQERLSALNEEKMALEARRTAQNKASQEMNENLLNLERSASRLEQKLATSGMEEKQIIDRLWSTMSSATPTPRPSASSWRASPRPPGVLES